MHFSSIDRPVHSLYMGFSIDAHSRHLAIITTTLMAAAAVAAVSSRTLIRKCVSLLLCVRFGEHQSRFSFLLRSFFFISFPLFKNGGGGKTRWPLMPMQPRKRMTAGATRQSEIGTVHDTALISMGIRSRTQTAHMRRYAYSFAACDVISVSQSVKR